MPISPDHEAIQSLEMPTVMKEWLLAILTYAQNAREVLALHEEVRQMDLFLDQIDALTTSQVRYESRLELLKTFPASPIAKNGIITAADLAARLNPHIKLGGRYRHRDTGEIGHIAGIYFPASANEAHLTMHTGRRVPVSGFLADWVECEQEKRS